MKKHIHALTLAFAFGFMGYAALKLTPGTFSYPYLWLFAGLAVFALNLFCLYTRRMVRMLAVNLAILGLGLLVLEAGGIRTEPLTLDQRRTIRYASKDPSIPAFTGTCKTLGTRPWPNNTVQVTYQIDETVLNLTYTIDARGLRVTPLARSRSPEALLFFGGSFMFGEGVNDGDALPHRIGVALRDRVQAYNFAFIGYGTHQMYAALESGFVFNVVGSRVPTLAVYQAIPDHIRRVLGQRPWTYYDPCYRLREQPPGSGVRVEPGGGPVVAPLVERLGNFNEQEPVRTLARRAGDQLRKSTLYRRVAGPWCERSSDEELALFVGLVEGSRRRLREHWPNLRFWVLYWDEDSRESDRQIDALRRAEIDVYRVSEILPAWRTNRAECVIHPHDEHPNAESHRRVADYLLHAAGFRKGAP